MSLSTLWFPLVRKMITDESFHVVEYSHAFEINANDTTEAWQHILSVSIGKCVIKLIRLKIVVQHEKAEKWK